MNKGTLRPALALLAFHSVGPVLKAPYIASYTGWMQTHDSEWQEYFASLGCTDVHPLAAGIEGTVYRLGSGLIGKVWARRSIPELVLLQRFYRDILEQQLRFQTPEIRDII